MRRVDLIYEDALNAFLEKESEFLVSDVSERSTCARLAYYLQLQVNSEGLSSYYADTEYNRKQDGKIKTILDENLTELNITADLIVHTRGELPAPHDNLIAIEAKKASRPEREKSADRKRLRAMTIPVGEIYPVNGCHPEHVCGYSVGIFLQIDINRRVIRSEFFKQGQNTKTKERPFNSQGAMAESGSREILTPGPHTTGQTGP